MESLTDKVIGFIVANEGIEQVELTTPWQAVQEAGGTPWLIAPEPGKAQAFNHLDKADTFRVDRTTREVSVGDLDGIVLPGGVANPDRLRMDKPAVQLLREAHDAGLPIAVICHGPWTLVEADVVRGRTMTSWPSLQTDLRNAGATWVDAEVQRCDNGPGPVVSSRKPDDLPAFCRAAVEAFAAARQRESARR